MLFTFINNFNGNFQKFSICITILVWQIISTLSLNDNNWLERQKSHGWRSHIKYFGYLVCLIYISNPQTMDGNNESFEWVTSTFCSLTRLELVTLSITNLMKSNFTPYSYQPYLTLYRVIYALVIEHITRRFTTLHVIEKTYITILVVRFLPSTRGQRLPKIVRQDFKNQMIFKDFWWFL